MNQNDAVCLFILMFLMFCLHMHCFFFLFTDLMSFYLLRLNNQWMLICIDCITEEVARQNLTHSCLIYITKRRDKAKQLSIISIKKDCLRKEKEKKKKISSMRRAYWVLKWIRDLHLKQLHIVHWILDSYLSRSRHNDFWKCRFCLCLKMYLFTFFAPILLVFCVVVFLSFGFSKKE